MTDDLLIERLNHLMDMMKFHKKYTVPNEKNRWDDDTIAAWIWYIKTGAVRGNRSKWMENANEIYKQIKKDIAI